METLTPNYGLRKQDGAEFYTEQINSDNMDIIDPELKKSGDHIADTDIHITATERTNYFTGFTVRVRDTVLTGLSTATNVVISATDTVLTALGKLQKQITDHKTDYTLQVPYGGTTTGTANTYVLASPTITALSAGMAVSVKFNLDSTGASTLNWCGLGAKSIKKANGTDVTNLKATGIYTLRYDGTNFILQGEGASGNATASDLISGKTATVDAGEITGAMPNNGAVAITPGAIQQAILSGYHNGSGYVVGDSDLIPANILSGKNIFGVEGAALVINGIIKNFLVTGGNISMGDFVNYIESVPTMGTLKNLYGSTTYATQVMRISSTQALVLYMFASGVYGVVYTISGTTITSGTPLAISSNPSSTGTLLSATSAIVSSIESSPLCNKARLLTISGTTITISSEIAVASINIENPLCIALSSTQAIMVYTDVSTFMPFAKVLTVSGTTLSVGAATQIRSARYNSQYSGVIGVSGTKALVYFSNYADTKGMAMILSVSGTTITVGTEFVFNSGTCYYITATLLTDPNYILIMCNTLDTSGQAYLLCISGMTLSVVGSPVQFNVAGPYSPVSCLVSENKVMVAYCDAGNGRYVSVVFINVLYNSTIVVSAKTVVSAYQSDYTGIAFLTNSLALITFARSGGASYGVACNFDTTSKSTSQLTIKGVAKTAATVGTILPVHTLT